MMDIAAKPYPGASATPLEIVGLAVEYHMAAEMLMLKGRSRKPASWAPARLCAIHATELYLNAFLLNRGMPPEKVRAHLHNLADRARLAVDDGLVLRKLTFAHLIKMTDDREYLVSRYGPELSGTLSETNRLMATLNEVAKKVKSHLQLLNSA
jgi:hypothetical protein